MVIGIYIRSLAKGGAEKQAILLAKHLIPSYETKLIVLYEEGELIEKAFQEIPGNSIFFTRGNNFLAKALSLYGILRYNKVDTLICYLPSNNITGIIIGKLARVGRVYGGIRSSKIKANRLKMFIQKFLMNNIAAGVVSNSYVGKMSYSNYGVREEKIHVIHNGIELHNQWHSRMEKPYISIISVGRFVEEKDYLTALKAILSLVQRTRLKSKSIHYVIAGYGELEKGIRQYISSNRLEKYVSLKINPPDIASLYEKADIFLMTSVYEGMPNAVMEAMSWSLPVVATNAGDTSYLVLNGHNGYLCNIGDSDDIADKLDILVKDFTHRNNLGKNGYRHLQESFSTNSLKNKYIELIKK